MNEVDNCPETIEQAVTLLKQRRDATSNNQHGVAFAQGEDTDDESSDDVDGIVSGQSNKEADTQSTSTAHSSRTPSRRRSHCTVDRHGDWIDNDTGENMGRNSGGAFQA